MRAEKVGFGFTKEMCAFAFYTCCGDDIAGVERSGVFWATIKTTSEDYDALISFPEEGVIVASNRRASDISRKIRVDRMRPNIALRETVSENGGTGDLIIGGVLTADDESYQMVRADRDGFDITPPVEGKYGNGLLLKNYLLSSVEGPVPDNRPFDTAHETMEGLEGRSPGDIRAWLLRNDMLLGGDIICVAVYDLLGRNADLGVYQSGTI
ncbi:MAG: hypothetical protein V3V26_00770 [Candidatus Aenigmarchaeota archaeon]